MLNQAGQDTLAAIGGHFEARSRFTPAKLPASHAPGAGGQDSIAGPGQVIDVQDAALITAAVNACTEGLFDARNSIAPVEAPALLGRLGIENADATVRKHLYSIYCGGWRIGRLTVGAAGVR